MKLIRSFTMATFGVAALAQIASAAPAATPAPKATPAGASVPVEATATIPKLPAVPPRVQRYVRVQPGVKVVEGHSLVPATFLQNSLGASIGEAGKNKWSIQYFSHSITVTVGESDAIFDDQKTTLSQTPRIIGGHLYVPWVPVAKLFGFQWSLAAAQQAGTGGTVIVLKYQAAYIEKIRHSTTNDKVRVVIDLSNATRVTARYTKSGVQIFLAAARRPDVKPAQSIGDYLVPRVNTQSGNWKAQSEVKLTYSAPATWFTMSNPPRVIVDVQRLFEKTSTQNLGSGLSFTKVFRGTGHGPVRLFLARVDPAKGWRVRIGPAGYGVLQRQRTSRIAANAKAPLAVNGGFFAFDGAAVGAVKINNEWIRLPWKGRSAIGFGKNGVAKIGNLQVKAEVHFSNDLVLPIRDLNGWPDRNRITAITRRFAPHFTLRPGDIAAVVSNGVITSTPGSGKVAVPAKGFVLVANGGGIPELQKVRRGLKATLKISAPTWNDFPSALGGGPRLVTEGAAEVKEEGFRTDVTNGLGPRTAIGIDKKGHYIIVVADGRQSYYSTGLTLQEMAYTMQKYGAVDAINLDGGGSAAIVVRNKVANRPSDGTERRVSNALLVMR